MALSTLERVLAQRPTWKVTALTGARHDLLEVSRGDVMMMRVREVLLRWLPAPGSRRCRSLCPDASKSFDIDAACASCLGPDVSHTLSLQALRAMQCRPGVLALLAARPCARTVLRCVYSLSLLLFGLIRLSLAELLNLPLSVPRFVCKFRTTNLASSHYKLLRKLILLLS